ncbi:MAG: nucleoside monophosphate kinase, partial [Thermus sp.]
MDLTPLDVRYQEFPTGLRGYQKEAVRGYLARVAEVMDRGELVTDEIVIGLIREQLDRGGKGFIFDGFPRTLA